MPYKKKKGKNNKKQNLNAQKIKLAIILTILLIGVVVTISEVGVKGLFKEGLNGVLNRADTLITDIFSGEIGGEPIRYKDGSTSTNRASSKKLSGDFELYVFDVGQADCNLIICDDEAMIIDAGNNEDGALIVSELQEMGIDEIKYLIGTHNHEDHIGGLDDIINNIDIVNLYMTGQEYDSATYRAVVKAAKNNKVAKVVPALGDKFSLGDATCEIMAIDSDNEETNETSIIVEVTYGDNKFLFMADAEIPNEEARLWNDVDVLKVGHHGSSTSTSEDFLAQTKPEVALISLGEGNEYGHPHKETMKALNEIDASIYRTDLQGTIHVISDGKQYYIETLEDIDLDGNK